MHSMISSTFAPIRTAFVLKYLANQIARYCELRCTVCFLVKSHHRAKINPSSLCALYSFELIYSWYGEVFHWKKEFCAVESTGYMYNEYVKP